MKIKSNINLVVNRIIAFFQDNWIKIVIFPFFAIAILLLYILLRPNIDISSIFPVPDDKKIFDLSIQSFKDGNYKNSINESNRLIEDYPNSRYIQDAMYNIGVAHRQMQNYVRSREAYKNLMEKYPKSKHKKKTQYNLKELSVLEAVTLFKEKQYNEAYEKFNRLATSNELKEFSDLQAEVKSYIISSLLKLRKYNEALDYAEEVVSQFSKNKFSKNKSVADAFALYISGHLNYTLKENYEQSLLYFQKLLDQYPESSYIGHAAVGLVLSLRKLNRDAEIQNRIKDLNEQFPQNNWVTTLKAYAEGLKQSSYAVRDIPPWEQTQAQNDARTAFKHVLNYKEKYLDLKGDTRYNIAKSYLDEYKYAFARLEFDKIMTTEFSAWHKLQEKAMYHAAFCLMKQNVHDEALSQYTEFLIRFPDSEYITDAYFDLGSLYADNKKDYELARFNYNRALQSPESPNHNKAKIQLQIGHTYYDIGRTYYNQDNFKKASSNFEEASNVYNSLLQEYPESEEGLQARLFLATIHRQEKRVDEAIRAFENIIANHSKKGESLAFPYTVDVDEVPLWANHIALSHNEIAQAFAIKKDFEKVFDSYARIVKKPAGDEQDLRKDPLAPFVLYEAMVVLCKLGRKDKLETFATTYIKAFGDINELSKDELILSAEAQLKFADVLRGEIKQYDKAAAEYAKLQKYPPIQHPRLELIKLRGKYYEGLCYEKSSVPNKSIEIYQEAIRLFESIFKPLVDSPNIDVPNVPKEVFDYCVRTARYYAGNTYFATNQFEKAIVEFEEFLKKADTESEKAKNAQDKIEEARRKLGAKVERPKSSADALDKLGSSEKSKNEKPLTAQDIAEIASGSTVFIEMEGIREYESGRIVDAGRIDKSGRIVSAGLGFGSGFFVAPGQIATNYHVIAPKYPSYNDKDAEDDVVFVHPLRGSARLVGTDRKYAIIGYTVIDPDQDLAILKVKAFGIKLLPFGNSQKVNQGDAVYPVGNPRGLVNVVSDGQISSIQWVESIRAFLNNRSELVSDVQRNDTPHKLIMMTAPISRGNSGGPVLNSKGEVIGISVGGATVGQNLNFAVPVNYLKALLKRTGTPKPLSDLEIVY